MGWFIAQSLAFIIIAALIGLAIGIWIGWIVWGRRGKGKHTAEKAEGARAGKTGATASEAAGSEAAGSEAAGTDATGTEATGSEATGSDAEAGEAAETPAEADRGAVHALAVAATADEERAAGDPDGAARGGEPGTGGGSLAGDGGEPGVGADASVRTDEPETAADGGSADDGSADGGSTDGGSTDGGVKDGGSADGGVKDGGVKDGGVKDGGVEDGDTDVAAAESDVVAAAEAVAREAAEANAAASEAPAAADETSASAEAAPQDDLKRIEGIGPKIAAALAAAGYGTYAKIAAASETELREAVAGQGIKFAPSATTWADQAQYLADGDEDGLQEYQDYLIGGQERRAKFNKDVDYADVDEIEGAEAKAEAIAQDEAETAAAEAAPEPEPEPQDLQRIEGIGPKIEAALKAAGYTTYAKIAAATEADLREALATAGIKFAPAATSWADQAQYLVDGDEDGLAEYQDYLIGGQERRAKFNEAVDYADVDEIEGAEAKAEAIAQDEAETAAAEAEAAASKPEPEPEPQDLQRIEGIGPKIEAVLKTAGYTTYAKVAGASETELREALAAGGIKFAPAATSWADQAQYLADGDEDGLAEYQDYLIGGQDRHAKFREDVDYTDVDEIEGAEAKAEAIAQDEAETAAAEAADAAIIDDDAEPTQPEVKA